MLLALLQCLIFLGFFPLAMEAQKFKNITVGSTLTAGDGSNSSWASPSGDFAFGFQPVAAGGGFIVAIWFDKIPEKTVTWSANRDNLAQQGSKVQLTADGLLLNDPSGTILITIVQGPGLASAAMLDTGNLVLADANGVTLWKSFDEPTDTILPTQIMVRRTELIARLSNTSYSSGRFKLSMQWDGNLVLYAINWPQTVQINPYFATSTVPDGYQTVYNQSGRIYVINANGTSAVQVLTDLMNTSQYRYQRAILEFDGVFRRYVYPNSIPANWTVQSFVPKDICKAMRGDTGRGACGFNSYCQIGDDLRPKCMCLPGYVLFDEMDPLRGCKLKLLPQSCSDEPQEDGQFEIREMISADLAGGDYEFFFNQSETTCSESCLSDCLCAAAVLTNNQCWKKRFPLSNGVVGTNITTKAFIKVRLGNSPDEEPCRHNKHEAKVLIESFLLGGSAFLNIILIALAVFTLCFCTRKRKEKPQLQKDIAGTNMRCFSYKELQEATDDFKEVIGQGAFAVVYKGLLDSKENIIAVKKLKESVQKNEREFEGEVKAIARTGHRNLVQLIGFCKEEQHRLLVYEYMPNGSIADILFKGERPFWSRRIMFAFEIARGLNYLHEECSIPIIHCDIKPQNILLDSSFAVRISDFGLAKLLKKDQTHTLTGIRGTKGYVAPEWFRSMPITTKVDVYSYGILLLEIICCRRCFVAEVEDESRMVLADWAYVCYKEGRIAEIVEGDKEALADIEKVKKFVMIAMCCIQEDPSRRPSMNEVVQMIKGEIEKSLPRNLAAYLELAGCGDAVSFSTENYWNSTERPETENSA